MNFAVIPGLGSVGPTELIIVLTIILLLFGAKRIPELARGLGSGIREFRKGTRGEVDEGRKTRSLRAGRTRLTKARTMPASGKRPPAWSTPRSATRSALSRSADLLLSP